MSRLIRRHWYSFWRRVLAPGPKRVGCGALLDVIGKENAVNDATFDAGGNERCENCIRARHTALRHR